MLGVEMERHDRERRIDEPTPRVHLPVLAAQVTRVLAGEHLCTPASLTGWIVDATLGAGGHAALLLAAYPNLRLLGFDQDPQILEHARRNLARFEGRTRIRKGRFSKLGEILHEEHVSRLVGVLVDLGASSLQFDSPARGFSMQADGPLDMRMDPDRPRRAADIVNGWDESDLADLFYYEGGETRSRRIARAIVEGRRRAPFLRTQALANLVERTVGRRGKTHPATKVFQALRRAVNEEGEELRQGLAQAEEWLVDGGRLAVISFHSGEDGEVKRFLSRGERELRWRLDAKKPIKPERSEVLENRRARSAVLRVGIRTRMGGTP